jgi:hypothetical protein
MLLESVAFNFVDAAMQSVYSLVQWQKDKVLKKLHTFEDIDTHPKTKTEQAK